jgi:predicted PurR-regulated permease PerM
MAPHEADWAYFRRLLIAVAVVALSYVVWMLAGILVLLFAAVLLAIVLVGLADVIDAYTPLPRRWALTAAIVSVAAFLAGVTVLFGAQLYAQLSQVFSKVPQALDAVGLAFGIPDASTRLTEELSSFTGGRLLSRAASIGFTVLGLLGDLVLVIVTAIYLAIDPRLYREGLTKLFHPDQQDRVEGALTATAGALRLWFAGQLISMTIVGLLSWAAFWLIGLPAPIGLALIAGLTNFIPLVGPLLGAVPAVLFAFGVDLSAVLWTIVAIFVIQQIEGNVLMPLLQQRVTSVPPAVVLFAIAGFGTLLGWLGVVFAVPIAVTVMVLVQKLWVRETLGEAVTIAGEEKPD